MVKTLKETTEMMVSPDYNERFKAEYYQLMLRFRGLQSILFKWDNGSLSFEPTCPRSIYNIQIDAMANYLAILEARAVMEGIELSRREHESSICIFSIGWSSNFMVSIICIVLSIRTILA